MRGRFTKRQILISSFFSVLAALFFEYGNILQHNRGLFQIGFGSLLNFAIYLSVFFFLALLLIHLLDYISKKVPRQLPDKAFRPKLFFIVWLLIFCCWIPYFLAFYPGIWAYDVGSQLQVADGLHPMLHTIFIQKFAEFGQSIGNENLGIAFSSLIQVLAMSSIFSYVVMRIRPLFKSRYPALLLAIFFALLPVNPIMSISSTKDVFFSGFFLLSAVLIYDFIVLPPKSYKQLWRQIPLILSLAIIMLLRNNALYVVIVWSIICLIAIGKHHRLHLLLVSSLSLLAYFGINAVLPNLIETTAPHVNYEAYSVPIQTIIGTAIRHPELVPEYGTHQSFLGIMDRDLLPEDLNTIYTPYSADPSKAFFNIYGESGINQERLIPAWIELGMKYPLDYIDIWSRLTLSSWHIPSVDYLSVYSEESNGYLQTNFIQSPELQQAHSNSKLPRLQQGINDMIHENSYTSNPFLFILFAPATYLWIIIFLAFYLIYRRRARLLLILLLPLLLYGTILLGPVIIVRYMYPIMISAPVLFLLLYQASLTRNMIK